MSVSPGDFRTNFLSDGSLQWSDKNTISNYDTAREEQKAVLVNNNKKQKGDPNKGMAVLIEAVESNEMPIHLTLGSDAYKLREEKTKLIEQELAQWKEKASKTDFN